MLGILAYGDGEYHAPGGGVQLLVRSALAQGRAHMDDRQAQLAALSHKVVEGLHNLAATGGGAGALGILGEMAVVHVDGNDGGVLGVEEHFLELLGNLFLHIVEVSFHLDVLLKNKYAF